MSTKVKGLLKGLRYISQIFDEDKEGEMQIGFPTDVKHVAHIGWDGNGPSADSPSWMKEFNSTTGYQSAPLAMSGGGGGADSKENPEIKWVSEDLTDSKNSRPSSSSSREHSLPGDNPDSPTKKESSRRHSRRSKDPSGNSIKSSSRQPPDSSSGAAGSESPAKSLPDIPKKTRRKKSKENVASGPGAGGSSSGSSRSSRSKEGGSVRSRRDVEKSQSSNLKPSNQVGEIESNCIS